MNRKTSHPPEEEELYAIVTQMRNVEPLMQFIRCYFNLSHHETQEDGKRIQ